MYLFLLLFGILLWFFIFNYEESSPLSHYEKVYKMGMGKLVPWKDRIDIIRSIRNINNIPNTNSPNFRFIGLIQ